MTLRRYDRDPGSGHVEAEGQPAEPTRWVDLAVPAYFHPSDAPHQWAAMVSSARRLRFVVVNVNSGPGDHLDPAYPPVIEMLRSARIRMVGYVDTAYGGRSLHDVAEDVDAWVHRYGLRGIFFDQVAGGFATLHHNAACAVAARAAGGQFVVMNPGGPCHEALADVANVLVTFEGNWAGYQSFRPPAWARTRPAGRFCHLVYDVPAHALPGALSLAADRHAGCAFFTPGRGANPWDRFPEDRANAAARELGGGALPPPEAARWPARRYAGADGVPVPSLTPPATPRSAAHRRFETARPASRAPEKEQP